jgi:multidrug efflux pump subunit AcrA (membrane-fusion protein)
MKSGRILCIVSLLLPVVCAAEEPVLFDRDVRPILSDRCFHCHGPNEHDRQAELRLDKADGPEGAYRTLYGTQPIKPGSLEESELWYRVNSEDDDVMPPPDSSKQPLSEAEKDILQRWIQQGAEYTGFWAFEAPRLPVPPQVDSDRFGGQAIDQFVYRRMTAEGLTPNPPAHRRTLLRRLSLDLTGLPPTREEIREFLADASADAYERLVDRLLAKPQFGEQMAKYWLDLVRFADTNGIHHDHYREMTPYRDWVIRAMNDNLPYDQFLTYQLAGDLFDQPTKDQLVASGFNRLHLIIDRGTALPEESYTRNVIDRVTAVGTAFMGLTVQCAVCHDHKYDPITTRDFYQLFAFFNNLDANPETGGRQGIDFERGLQPPYISLASEAEHARLAQLEAQVEKAQAELARAEQQLKQASEDAGKEGAEKETAGQERLQKDGTEKNDADKADAEKAEAEKKQLEDAVKAAKQALAEIQAAKRALQLDMPMAMVMKERKEPRPAYILMRGAYDNLGERVQRDTPAFLPPLKSDSDQKTRMDLARWFVAPENPLTARVAVNRFWQQFFGVGLVKTAEDFGAQGEWPSHPELLDYLAVTFVESGWDVKRLLKEMVMSETYRQSSAATPAQFEADPENRLLARGSRFRLDAEVIRDQILATSGLLNDTMYGKSVKPPQPQGLWKTVSMPSSYPRDYVADTGDKIYRRSLYTFWKRGMPPPQMTILNAPTREACIARRERTNTPLQALLLLNETEYLKAARQLALTTIADPAQSDADRLDAIYETITARLPDDAERNMLLKLVGDLQQTYASSAALADELCAGAELPPHVSAPEMAAWTMLVSTIYNLDITKTRS